MLTAENHPFGRSSDKAEVNTINSSVLKATEEAAERFLNDPDCTPCPTTFHLVILPIKTLDKTDSGLLLPEESMTAQRVTTSVGIIVAMGAAVYEHPKFKFEKNKPELGQWWHYHRHAGSRFNYAGEDLILISDEGLLSTVPDPLLFNRKV